MYSRDTEIRHLLPNDVHMLAVMLDDNNRWRNLMEVIPKSLNASESSSADSRMDVEKASAVEVLKYDHDHIRQIESAFRRPGETRLYAEILFQEWGTSGRRDERPTVGVLLQLLVRAELFRAADFVAEKFLNEPKPARPQNGPGAFINISLSDDDFDDIKSMVDDSSFYPETAALNDNANYANSVAAENNKDYYTKYHQRVDKQVLASDSAAATAVMATNEFANASAAETAAPKPPPRMLRSARLQQQQLLQQQQQQNASEAAAATVNTAQAKHGIPNDLQQRQEGPHNNGIDGSLPATISPVATQSLLPKFSTLLPSTAASAASTDIDDSSAQSRNTEESTLLSEAPIPLISILAETTNTTKTTTNATKTEITAATLGDANDAAMTTTDTNEILPVISALNLNGEHETNAAHTSSNRNNSSSSSERSRSSSLSDDDDDQEVDIELPPYNAEDDDDDEDNSMPMLSILDQRSSNNDSSLTTVTGTSGENSFEMSMNDNGSFSASNENIPCLSALKQ